MALFNFSLQSGFIPDHWKTAIVIPILKPNKPAHIPKSYRPISLTSCLSKTIERMINNRLYWHIDTKNIIPAFQIGFKRNRSTIDHIISLESYINLGFNNKEDTYSIFLDLFNAYPATWLQALLLKISKIGVTGPLLRWIKNFLLKRSMQTKIDNCLSTPRILNVGVPQGTVLSPLLFNVMLYDFPPPPKSCLTQLYVDDVTTSTKAKTPDQARKQLQPYLNRISWWAKTWKFSFSIDKSSLVIFSKKRDLDNIDCHFVFGNEIIPRKKEAKFLGIIFSDTLSWKKTYRLYNSKIY